MTTIGLYLFSSLFRVVMTTYGIGVAGILIFVFCPAWVPGRFRNLAGIIGICLLCGGSFYWVAFHQGETFMAQKIAARDWEALQRVEAGQREVNDCNGGIDWNVTEGRCDK